MLALFPGFISSCSQSRGAIPKSPPPVPACPSATGRSEGSGPPQLYHYYTGHDDNRDWYAFTQVETRYTVDSLYTPWDPQIVNDIHQQGANAGRIFIPPYMDPVEPNIDPILTAATNAPRPR